MIRKVLVTGGLGYLGGRLCHHLSAQLGLDVRVTTSRIDAEAGDWTSALDIRHLDLRQTNAEELASLLEGVDAVVHLAALNAQQCKANPVDAITVNIGGTQALVSAAAESGVNRFVYISTARVYGTPLSGRIDESVTPHPRHPYASTHREAEDIVLGTRDLGGVVLRLSNAIGFPMDERANCWRLVGPNLCRQAVESNHLTLLGDGSAMLDFICMSDAVRAIAHILELPDHALGDGLFNVSTGRSIPVIALAERIASVSERVLGTKPEISISKGSSGETQALHSYISDKIAGTGFLLKGDLDSELTETLLQCRKYFGPR